MFDEEFPQKDLDVLAQVLSAPDVFERMCDTAPSRRVKRARCDDNDNESIAHTHRLCEEMGNADTAPNLLVVEDALQNNGDPTNRVHAIDRSDARYNAIEIAMYNLHHGAVSLFIGHGLMHNVMQCYQPFLKRLRSIARRVHVHVDAQETCLIRTQIEHAVNILDVLPPRFTYVEANGARHNTSVLNECKAHSHGARLIEAAKAGRLVRDEFGEGVVELLSQRDGTHAPLEQRRNGDTPLLAACRELNNVEVIKTLIDSGARIEAANADGRITVEVAMRAFLDLLSAHHVRTLRQREQVKMGNEGYALAHSFDIVGVSPLDAPMCADAMLRLLHDEQARVDDALDCVHYVLGQATVHECALWPTRRSGKRKRRK